MQSDHEWRQHEVFGTSEYPFGPMPPQPRKNEELHSQINELKRQIEGTDAFKKLAEAGSDAARQAVTRDAIARNRALSAQSEQLRKAIARWSELLQERVANEESELLRAAIRWVEDKWDGQPCPYCQHTEWQVGTPLEITVAGDEVMSPAFPVMCGNCGHTTFVNAIRAGLQADSEDEE